MLSLSRSQLDLQRPASDPDDAVLIGHSGARLTLRQSEGHSVIRKMAGWYTGNERLRRQADKQETFRAAGFSTPRVLRKGTDDGLFFFEMEYVPAMSIAAQCSGGGTTSLRPLVAFMTAWIAHLQGLSTSVIAEERIHAKLDSIIESCRRNPVLRHAMPAISLLGSLLAQAEWPAIPEGPCHGDLTLENILVDVRGQLWLIDFDAPDLMSYWFDIAKLYQDLRGHWCLRHMSHDPSSPSRLNAIMAIRRVRSAVDDVVNQAVPELSTALPLLVALCPMRALPYCKDIDTAIYILDRSRAVIAE